MSPKDLDKIFQKGSEQYDFEYNEEAWNHMESLLEKDDRHRFLWWWFAGIGTLLVFGILGYFLQSNSLTKDQITSSERIGIVEKNNDLTNSTPSERGLLNEHKISNPDFSNSSLKNKNTDQPINTKNSNLEKSIASKSPNKKSSVTKSSLTEIIDNGDNADLELQPNIQSMYFNVNDNPEKLGLDQTTLLENNQQKLGVLIPKEKGDIIYLTPLTILNIDFVSEDLPVLEFGEDKAIIKNEGEGKNKAFLIGAIIGTEFSAIGSDNISEQELKYGGQIEYRFRKKFSTSLGVSYIKKDYSADGDDYKVEPYYWEYGISPTKVIAHCDMLEIPIKVSYFFKDFSENGFYSSLGLTSYLMRSERYYYKYAVENPNQRKNWMGTNENNHWLGLGHVAFGYQRHIGSKFSVQIEPYAELPLSRIGHGNVRLWSFGVSGKFNFHVK